MSVQHHMRQRAIAVLTAISIGITFFDHLSCSSLSVGLDQTGQHLPPTCANELSQSMTLVRHHSFFWVSFYRYWPLRTGNTPTRAAVIQSCSHHNLVLAKLTPVSRLGRRVEVEKFYPSADTVNELLFAVGTEHKQKRNMTKTTLNKDLNEEAATKVI